MIDGGVGAGKSTVKCQSQCLLRRESIPYVSVDEPVQVWRDAGLLDTMYSGDLSLASFQYMSLASRTVQLIDALGGSAVSDLIICERGPWSDAATFAHMGVAAGAEAACARPRSLATIACTPS